MTWVLCQEAAGITPTSRIPTHIPTSTSARNKPSWKKHRCVAPIPKPNSTFGAMGFQAPLPDKIFRGKGGKEERNCCACACVRACVRACVCVCVCVCVRVHMDSKMLWLYSVSKTHSCFVLDFSLQSLFPSICPPFPLPILPRHATPRSSPTLKPVITSSRLEFPI